MAGFGGVAEYGITVRWDKNFLKLIYLTLMRRPHFQVFGGVRFGGTLTIEDAWEMGFDHFVVAVGAGLPKALAIPGLFTSKRERDKSSERAHEIASLRRSSAGQGRQPAFLGAAVNDPADKLGRGRLRRKTVSAKRILTILL